MTLRGKLFLDSDNNQYELLIELKGLPPMANGSHGSWQRTWAIKKAWKQRVGYLLMDKAPQYPYKKIKVRFTRYSSVEPDYDGLVHGFKAVKDALVEYGFAQNDKISNMESEYRWIKAKAKEGKITIEITPIRT